MYDAGINEKDIQRMSGHTTADMTRHYNKSICLHYQMMDATAPLSSSVVLSVSKVRKSPAAYKSAIRQGDLRF